MTLATEYVQARDGNLYVGPSRVTIDSVVISWRAGQTPEQIQANFPTLPLSDVYGAIAYYLEHRDEVDAWVREGEALFERERAAQQAANPEFYTKMRERMEAARERLSGGDAGPESAAR